MAQEDMSGSFKAQLTETSGGLTVEQFVALPNTPGNVGICLSGGGSRALSAGMGELRGLAYLQLNGQSLLSQTKAISTVSGGSWLGVTFEFLTSGTSDADFLNEYVPDPDRLVPTTEPGHSAAETLDELPEGNIGTAVDSDLFSVPGLAVEAYLLYKFFHTPLDFLWQALMGAHILAPYGLYNPGDQGLPTSLFSWDTETLQSQVTGPNPQLGSETAHLVAGGAGRIRRPFLICNTAMFLSEPKTGFQPLAPVEATAFITGIVGAPTGTDANGRTPGGGGVTSFAFSSNPTAVQGTEVTVSQQRQLSLTDIVGASSAAFADTLRNQFAIWEQDPQQFLELLAELAEDLWDWIEGLFSHLDLSAAQAFVQTPPELATAADLASLKADFQILQGLIPEYQYWPVEGVQPYPQTNPTGFADGGSLENTGVNAMLAYTDVDNVIAFLNSSTPMAAASHGMIDANGQEVPGTRVVITTDIPPLFGYQPYNPRKGYVLYAGDPNPVFPQGANSQVFESSLLADVIQGLWAASGSGANSGSAVYKQTLAVQDRAWFGVRGGRTVNVLWVYPNRAQDWFNLLNPDVQALLAPFDDPRTFNYFPHYSTFDTDLTSQQINLLANFTAWMVAAPENAPLFLGMYQG
ncbi:MAG TPA: hypothetical protein VGG03_05050 [Thermoanaerobaculia bacterium]|jgi:hypothetical protein